MLGIILVYHWTSVLLINTAIYVITNFRVRNRPGLKLDPHIQISWDYLEEKVQPLH